jgi:hypothetical protein
MVVVVMMAAGSRRRRERVAEEQLGQLALPEWHDSRLYALKQIALVLFSNVASQSVRLYPGKRGPTLFPS